MTEIALDAFWQDQKRNFARQLLYVSIAALVATIAGVTGDANIIRADAIQSAYLVRFLLAVCFLTLIILCKITPRFVEKWGRVLLGVGFLITAVAMGQLSLWSEKYSELYLLGLLEAELAVAIFVTLPGKIYMPLVALVNLGYAGLVLPTDTDPDHQAALLVTMIVFAIISVLAGKALTQARFHEYIEMKKSEELKNKYSSIVSSITDALFVVDPGWNFLFFNEAAKRMVYGMNQDPAYLLQKNIWKEFPNLIENSKMYDAMQTASSEGKRVQVEEYFPLLKMWLQITSYPTEDGISVLGTDITVHKKIQEESRLRAVETRVNKVREEEKVRIARNLHDDLGQILAVLKRDILRIGKHKDMSPEQRAVSVGQAADLVQQSLDQVKKITNDLHPDVIESHGLMGALEWLVMQLSRAGIPCELDLPPSTTLDSDSQSVVFRIAQESCTNIIKHSQAKMVWLTLIESEEEVNLMVEDNGIGIPEEYREGKSESLGVRGMKERAASLGGKIDISVSKRGTSISLRFRKQSGEVFSV